MKVQKTFSLDLEVVNMIAEIAKDEKIKESAAAEALLRHGFIRRKQLDMQMTHLAPDNADLR